MLFSKIIGQQTNKEYLTHACKTGRLPHALLLHGRQGSAKLALALAISQYIVCTDKRENDSCGQCSACRKATKLIHPDIHYVFPVVKKEGKKREETTSGDFLHQWRGIIANHPYFSMQSWMHSLQAENSQPNINTRECNDIIHKLSLQTFESDSKVLIVWMPEYLGKEGNRLLKIIEEPTDNTHIILVAEDLSAILNTIISRTQLVHVLPFNDEEMISYLMEDKGLAQDIALQVANLADGDMAKALETIDSESIDYSEMLFQWIRLSYKSAPEKLIDLVNQLSRWGREEQKNFLQYGLHFFREYLFYLNTGQRPLRMNEKEYEIAQKMKSILDITKSESITSMLDASISHISRNANAKISFMADSMSLGSIMRGEQVSV